MKRWLTGNSFIRFALWGVAVLIGFTVCLLLSTAHAAAGDVTVIEVQGGDLENALRGAVEEATSQLGAGTSLRALLTSPPFLLALFTALGSIATYIGTNGVKLSTMIKGKQTQLVAWFFAALTAGVGGYFGLSEVAGVDGWEGVALAVLPTVGSFWFAHSAHETKRYNETGMRKPQRKAAKQGEVSATLRLAAEGLKTFAKGFGVPPFVVDTLVSEHGLAEAQKLLENMQRERALTVEEADAENDRWEQENAITQAELDAAVKKLTKRKRPPTKEPPKVRTVPEEVPPPPADI